MKSTERTIILHADGKLNIEMEEDITALKEIVVQSDRDERVVGMKMYGIRRNSVLGRLGVQNGDMVRTMNGFDLTSPDTALEAYTRLSGADSLSLSVVRRGQPLTIDYSVQ